MKYKKVARKNPGKPEEAPKYYAQPVWDGIVGIDELAEVIAGRSSLTKGDVLNVLENCLDEIPRYLRMGKAVKLEKIGILRASFGSEGAVSPDKFRTSLIRDEKIIFLPSVELKEAIVGKLSYECVDPKTPTEPSEPKTPEGSGGGGEAPDP